jgi:hypothetical protein
MAHPSRKALAYVEKAQKMDWSDLIELWGQIKRGHTPGWEAGKALGHLIVRAFKLSDLDAEYSYDVPLTGKPIEQIDGIIYLDDLAFLIECKDVHRVNARVIAKMFFGAQGYTSLASLARNILVKEGVPVLVVADADAVPPEQVRDENMSAIKSIAPVAPFGVAVFSPSLEAVATEATEATSRSVHELPADTGLLDPIAVAALRKHPQVQAFLNSLARLKSKCAAIYELEADADE